MKHIFSLFFILTFSCVFSQNLTLEEIVNLRNEQFKDVKKLLLNKNWEIMHEHYSNEYKFGDIRFAFDKNNIDKQMPTYITLYHESNEISKNRIEFSLLNKEKFDSYLAQLKTSDFKYVNSKLDVNYTTEIYKNATTTIEVQTMPVENYYGKQQTFYSFLIIDSNYKKTEYKF